jgi:hypothetical protein
MVLHTDKIDGYLPPAGKGGREGGREGDMRALPVQGSLSPSYRMHEVIQSEIVPLKVT